MYGMRLDTKDSREQYRASYIKTYNATATEHKDANTTICTYETNGVFYAFSFEGNAGKNAWHYRFSTEAKRAAYIEKYLTDRRKTAEYKAERKEKNKGHLTGAAATAAAIRARLKEEFPEVKFSVTSDTFSMGNSVHIRWTDGPVCSLVDYITDDYQSGSFDGMNDCYNYREIDPALNCPGAKYVHTERTQSEERKEEVKAHCIAKYGRIPEQYAQGNGFNAWYYENNTPDTWDTWYRLKKEAQDAEQARIYQEQEEQRRAEYEKQRQAEEQEDAEEEQEAPAPSNVVNLFEVKQEKEHKEQRESWDEMKMLIAFMSDDQLITAALEWDKKTEGDCKRFGLRVFIEELNSRDKSLALDTFKKTSLWRE